MRESLRDVLVNLEQHGKLIRVFKSVDVGWEVACLVNGCFKPSKNQTAAAFGLKTSQDTTFQLSSALWVYQPKFMRTSLALSQRK